MIAIFIAAWIASFLLSLVFVWVVVHFHDSIGLFWTAFTSSTVSTVLLAINMRDRAEG